MPVGFTLDHVGVVVPDLERARRSYERLGFRLTPVSSHRGPTGPGGAVELWGSGNHCAMFRQGYLELLGITDPKRYHDKVRDRLNRYHGLQLIALGTSDVDAVRKAWAGAVGSLPPVIEVGRDVPFASGATRHGAFRIVYTGDAFFPEAELFAIQHLTPEVLWQPEVVEQPNGTVSLRGVTLVAAEPNATAARLRQLGVDSTPADGGYRVWLAEGAWIDILDPDGVACRFPQATPARHSFADCCDLCSRRPHSDLGPCLGSGAWRNHRAGSGDGAGIRCGRVCRRIRPRASLTDDAETMSTMSKADLQAVIDDCPYHQFLRMTVEAVDSDRGEVVIRLPFRPDFARSAKAPQVHGGVTAALIDIAGDYAIACLIGRGVPTINLRVDYLRMATQTDLIARARVLKAGRSIGVVDIDVEDNQGRLIAVGRANYGTGGPPDAGK